MNPEFLIDWLGRSEEERQKWLFSFRRTYYQEWWRALESGEHPDLTLFHMSERDPVFADYFGSGEQ